MSNQTTAKNASYLVTEITFANEAARAAVQAEQMGSKEKYWLTFSGATWLVKFPRVGKGEHWSEKVAAEVAQALGVPHAEVELGTVDARAVSLTKNFLHKGQTLIHGNELLAKVVPAYPTDANRRGVQEHTPEAVQATLRANSISNVHADSALDAFGTFVGYLLLDALVGNTDRHHENWGVVAVGHGAERSSASPPHMIMPLRWGESSPTKNAGAASKPRTAAETSGPIARRPVPRSMTQVGQITPYLAVKPGRTLARWILSRQDIGSPGSAAYNLRNSLSSWIGSLTD